MARSRRDENRAIRQEALREQLSHQKHIEHVVDLIERIESVEDKLGLDKLKVAIDSRLKLVSKYLPDVKQVENTHIGDPDRPVAHVHREMTQEEASRAYQDAINGLPES